jgi:beta-lactamase regulating signal transducer with metallopeptidase domain
MDTLNSAVVVLNDWGRACGVVAGRMLIQSSILVLLLLLADRCLRTRVSARFRYGLWLLVLVKLLLPPSLALPTGINYWLGSYWPAAAGVSTAPVASQPPVPVVPLSPSAFATPSGQVVTMPAGAQESTPARRAIVPLQGPGAILLGWIAGVSFLSVLVLRRVVSVRRSLRRSRPASRAMVALLQECRADLRVATPVTLRLTDEMRGPCVCGFARPVILLPTVLPPGLGPEGLRTILTHELAHVKRWDPWVNLAQTALQIVYFWHPLVWAANTKLRDLRELAVDETVVTTLRSQAQCYTDTLIDIAEMALRKPAFSLRLIGIAESRRALERRITHMSNQRLFQRPRLGLSGLLLIAVVGAVLVPMGPGSFTARAEQQAVQSVPALPPGIAELFSLSKDQILEKFGPPTHIFYGGQTYTLENLPETYYLRYADLSFCVNEGTVVEITLLSPNYVFSNGLRVGDPEDKAKQAFGPDFLLRESEDRDFLAYDFAGIMFEINKQNRAHSIMEINIAPDYGTPGKLQAYARAVEFTAQLPQKLVQLDMDSAGLEQVLAIFGPPVKYIWGPKTLSPDALPNRFIAVYPGDFHVFMMNNHIVEVRFEGNSKYVYAGKLRIGSTLEEALAVLGAPARTVEGEAIDWSADNVLFKDIDGNKGHCYYHRPDQAVRVWFGNYKVAAIYVTRSDYGDDSAEPVDPEFARLLPERVAALDIDSAGLEQVRALFGAPNRYIWGDQTFQADALPDHYIMCYPCGFRVYMSGGRIVEIRHEAGSPYVYRGKLALGSTLEEALDLLGQPEQTVTGQENTFKDKVLYRDIKGERGHDYYHRSDQKVRVWFVNDKVCAIYMTRSDYSGGSFEPFDPEFARLLPDRVAALDIDSAGRDQVIALFGPPSGYVWGNQTFTPDALPDNYIMGYPCSFSVWLQQGRIMEIRHSRGSPYVYRGKLRIGSTIQEAVDLLGEPTETVTGQKNEFKDGVLYRNVDGNEGQAYYHRSDQKVRLFFWEGEVIAIYMTRSDFPTH